MYVIFWTKGTGARVQQTGVYVQLFHVLANFSHSQPQFAHLYKGSLFRLTSKGGQRSQ